jgi:hypothetical protein
MNNITKKQIIRLSDAHTLEERSPFRFPLNVPVILKPTKERATVLDALFSGYLSGGHCRITYAVLTEAGQQVDIQMYELRAA